MMTDGRPRVIALQHSDLSQEFCQKGVLAVPAGMADVVVLVLVLGVGPAFRGHATACLPGDDAAGGDARTLRGLTRRARRPQPVCWPVAGPRETLDARLPPHAARPDPIRASDAEIPRGTGCSGTIVEMTRRRYARRGRVSDPADNVRSNSVAATVKSQGHQR